MHGGVWFRKNNFWQNDSCENLDNFSLIRFCKCLDGAYIFKISKIIENSNRLKSFYSISAKLGMCHKGNLRGETFRFNIGI